jgi:hypothetical protein
VPNGHVAKVDRFEVPDLVLLNLLPRLVRARGECRLRTCRAINTHLGYIQHGHTCTRQVQKYLFTRPSSERTPGETREGGEIMG